MRSPPAGKAKEAGRGRPIPPSRGVSHPCHHGVVRRFSAFVGLALLAAGCTSAAVPEAAPVGTVRLLVAGTVDLAGSAAMVAASDPESLFRELRLAGPAADLAVVVAAPGQAEALLGAAGFDAVACPRPRSLAGLRVPAEKWGCAAPGYSASPPPPHSPGRPWWSGTAVRSSTHPLPT